MEKTTILWSESENWWAKALPPMVETPCIDLVKICSRICMYVY